MTGMELIILKLLIFGARYKDKLMISNFIPIPKCKCFLVFFWPFVLHYTLHVQYTNLPSWPLQSTYKFFTLQLKIWPKSDYKWHYPADMDRRRKSILHFGSSTRKQWGNYHVWNVFFWLVGESSQCPSHHHDSWQS